MKFLTDYAAAVLDKSGELLEYRHLIKRPEYKEQWGYSFGNEIGRLAQRMPGKNKGTNTIFFINKREVPPQPLERHDIRQDCLQCPSQKRRNQPNKAHHGWRQDQHTNGLQDSHSKPSHRETSPQQHHIHARREVSWTRPQGLLPQHAYGTAGISTNENRHFPRRCNRALQTSRQGR